MVLVVAAAINMPVMPDLKGGWALTRRTGEIVHWRYRFERPRRNRMRETVRG